MILFRWYVRLLLRAIFRRFTVTGLEHLPESGAVLLVGNHLNGPLDGMMLFAALDRRVTLTAHPKLMKNPLLALIIRGLDVALLGEGRDGLRACKRALARGEAVVIFPEGKSHDLPRMLPFKKGAALLARTAECPVVPFGLSFSNKSRFRGDAQLSFGPAVREHETAALERAVDPLRRFIPPVTPRLGVLRALDTVLLGLPLFAFGVVANALPHLASQVLSTELSSDLDHIDSNRFFAAMVLYPLFYLLGAIALHPLFFALAPITGLYALAYADRLRAMRPLSRKERPMIDLRDPAALNTQKTGGKGAQLARLLAHGFSVPEGFVISAEVYAELTAPIFAELGPCPADDEAALAYARVVRRKLATSDLPSAFIRDVTARVQALGGARFAVRSSSTLEDLEHAAFAGQHDTFLQVSDVEVAARVRDCFLSLWSDHAVRYRHRQNTWSARSRRLGEAQMAVVVQTMVDSQVAGVCFGLDPVSGDLDRMIVAANHGLGESVVSGAARVDHYALDRRTMQVVAQNLATGSLDAAQLAELGRTVLRIEAAFGFRQDVEWAFDPEGALRILQSRPVTTIPARWTRDESAERFPGAMTPLCWELAEAGFHESLASSLALMGRPAFHGKWFTQLDGHIYGNANAVRLFLGDWRPPFATIEQASQIDAAAHRWVLDLPERWTNDLGTFLTGIGRLSVPIAGDSAVQWARVLEIDALGRAYFAPNIAISIGHALLHRTLHGLVALVFAPAEAASLYRDLTGAVETKTGAVNRELCAIVAMIEADPGARAALEGGRALESPAIEAAIARVIATHAHREIDPDPYHPTWGDAPHVVMDTLRAMLAGGAKTVDPLAARAVARRAERRAEAALPEAVHDLFSELVRLARTYSMLDDWEHYETTRLHHLMRRQLLGLGAALALPRADDVFFLRRTSLEAHLAGTRVDLAAEATTARLAYQRQRAAPPAWEWDQVKTATIEAQKSDLTGIPGSPGVASGAVFIVESTADFSSFPRGAVLVARSTNPAWTSLFYGAAAVITEAGGPLSHGAVTARELGLPAVMAVRDCLTRLTNGQRVRVDGSTGAVKLLS